jgi:multidrug efflux pump subunit AcrA (membrane-fusion protein)
MTMKNLITLSLIACFLIYSCKTANDKNTEKQAEGKVPVTTTHPEKSTMVEAVELNATSSFLVKTLVKSNVTGYLQEVNVQLGDRIGKGDKMFVVRSKESESLGNTINKLDSTLKFSGLVNILSNGIGYITKLDYQGGDYVQDGETLAEISDLNSLVFLLDLPYELKEFLPLNKNVTLTLPDGQKLAGTITKPMPTVDPVSQTQNYVIKVYPVTAIPGDLIAKVAFIKNQKKSALSLPKEAIITNETQSEFWIMKMTDSITAVKVPVEKGIESSGRVEILSPKLKLSDIILLTGNFGIPDTTGVSIIEGKE